MNFPIYGKTSKPLTKWLQTEAQFGICKSPFLLNCATGSTSEIIPSPVMNQQPPETKMFYSLGFTHRTILRGDGIITLDWTETANFQCSPCQIHEPNQIGLANTSVSGLTAHPGFVILKSIRSMYCICILYIYVYVEISTTLGVVSNVRFDGHSIPSSLIVFHTSHYSPPLYPTWPMDYLIIFHSAPVYVP